MKNSILLPKKKEKLSIYHVYFRLQTTKNITLSCYAINISNNNLIRYCTPAYSRLNIRNL